MRDWRRAASVAGIGFYGGHQKVVTQDCGGSALRYRFIEVAVTDSAQ